MAWQKAFKVKRIFEGEDVVKVKILKCLNQVLNLYLQHVLRHREVVPRVIQVNIPALQNI